MAGGADNEKARMNRTKPYYRDEWVEIESPEQMISQGMLDFIGIVMRNEGLAGWKVDIWACWGEGECHNEWKEICVGLCATEVDMKRLFLHEVAHALDNEPLGEWHKASWLEKYKALCGKYMAGVPFDPLGYDKKEQAQEVMRL